MSHEIGGPRRAVEVFLDAFERMDHTAIVSCFDENAVLVIPFDIDGDPDPWFTFTGRDEINAYWRNAVTKLQSMTLSSRTITVGDDDATVFCEATGDMILAGASAEQYQNVYVLKFTIENSKIERLLEYANPVVAARLGGGNAIAGLHGLGAG
jgi:ketosteroid isomerase-like protein